MQSAGVTLWEPDPLFLSLQVFRSTFLIHINVEVTLFEFLWTNGWSDDSAVPLQSPCSSTTYQHCSVWAVFAPLVPHGQQHQAQRGGGGVFPGRQLNCRRGELALIRAHASLHNYPLYIETAPPTPNTHTHNNLTNTTINGRWTVTEQGQRPPAR